MDETNGPRSETSHATSDNRYPERDTFPGARYNATQVADMVGITPQWVRRLASSHHIGIWTGKTRKYLTLSADEVTTLATLLKNRILVHLEKSVAKDRNVSPTTPEDALAIAQLQEETIGHFRLLLKQSKHDIFMFLSDMNRGLHNRLSKIDEHYDRKLFDQEEAIKQLRSEIGELKRRLNQPTG